MQLQYKNTPKHLGYAALAVLLLIATNSSFAQNTNSLDVVSGYVTVTTSDGNTRRAKAGEALEVGDTITTGEDSSASIMLADGTVINLGELSSYTIGDGSDEDDSTEVGVGGGDGYGEGDSSPPPSVGTRSPTLSTATSAGGGIADGDASSSPTN